MRQARVRPDWQDTWHHCYNRIAGCSGERPFGNAEKEMFVRVLLRVAQLYAVRVVAYQFMSNHFHILLQTPADSPSEAETCARFEAFHHGTRHLIPGSDLCQAWQQRLRDVSWFMSHVQHLHTAWFNRSRPVRRRGTLWAGRFKNTILESGTALWACWTYIEFNPVRAGLVADSADYRFGSFGAWAQSGRHPFADSLVQHLIPALPQPLCSLPLEQVLAVLRTELAQRAAELAHAPEPAVEQMACEPPLSLKACRRVRYWTDGLVIGSAIFVRDVMRRARSSRPIESHRLAKATDSLGQPDPICSWRRLRVIQV